MSSAIVATQIHRPSTAPDNESKSAIEQHGCEYYASATHPGLIALALKVVPLAQKALASSDQFVYDAGPLLVGETEASYQLQKLIIEALEKQTPGQSYSCAVDCQAHMDNRLGRYVPHTTVYVMHST